MILDLVLIATIPAFVWFLLHRYAKLPHVLLAYLAIVLLFLGIYIDGKITGLSTPDCADCGLAYAITLSPVFLIYALLAFVLSIRWVFTHARRLRKRK